LKPTVKLPALSAPWFFAVLVTERVAVALTVEALGVTAVMVRSACGIVTGVVEQRVLLVSPLGGSSATASAESALAQR